MTCACTQFRGSWSLVASSQHTLRPRLAPCKSNLLASKDKIVSSNPISVAVLPTERDEKRRIPVFASERLSPGDTEGNIDEENQAHKCLVLEIRSAQIGEPGHPGQMSRLLSTGRATDRDGSQTFASPGSQLRKLTASVSSLTNPSKSNYGAFDHARMH